jgi:hypothetical protein
MAPQGKKTTEEIAPVDPKFPTPRKAGRAAASRRSKAKKQAQPLTIWEKLRKWGGRGKGLPSDLAARHDFYLHGRSDV